MSNQRITLNSGQTWRRPRMVSRRGFVGGSSAGLLAAALASCTGGGQSSRGGDDGGSGTVQWWDQFRPLTTTLEEALFEPYMAENSAITVERRQLDAPELGEALQVARRSNQLPDVHSLAGLDSAPAALVSEGWFQPISDYVDIEGSDVGDQLFDGRHRFDGGVYSVPLFTSRLHETIPWYNTALIADAGIDPDEEPATWDDLRAMARRVSENTDAHGLFIPGQEPAYLSGLVNRLAQSAGAPGEIDWRTGEYVQDSEPFAQAVEFIRSLQADGVVHPASPSMGPRDARARWAAGEGAIYLWGSWFIGGLLVDEPEAVERGVSCWHIPTPESERNLIYNAPSGGVFWLSADAGEAEAASELILQMTTPEFQAELAAAMDQPPALLEVVEDADVHPAYALAIANFAEDVRIAPSPEVGNPGVWRVQAEMRDVRPHVGDMLQSLLAGEDVDVDGELRRYKDAISAERERAIEAVAEEADIDTNAWVFSNWDPESDYAVEDYDAR
ncbi:ABC transporter substrate-binding protein [Ruania halotolerans]|uniref:ABC transporter substrate-binding protein n=1 Tax=Ruania halotolerans TaxID=2897773 RepID=UPI001E4FE440|nr:extracellular solute-binding protein [Ruania halotolerans]UFU06489.1 extracellular solute-binding protein [Ruania halotolerans]